MESEVTAACGLKDLRPTKQYRVIQKKYPNTNIPISQKCVKILAPKFAHLFRTKLRLSVALRYYLLHLCQNDANANFKNEFRN